jgi:hypothetical protein
MFSSSKPQPCAKMPNGITTNPQQIWGFHPWKYRSGRVSWLLSLPRLVEDRLQGPWNLLDDFSNLRGWRRVGELAR